VLDGELPVNHSILGNLQDVFNLLPNLSTPRTTTISSSASANGTNGVNGHTTTAKPADTENSELARAMAVKTNDQLMAIYLSSLIRAITAFHDLIENKIQNRQAQEEKENGKGANGREDANVERERKGNAATNGEAKTEGEKAKDKEKEGKSTDKRKG